MTPYATHLAVLFYGLCVGSFLNVCIYRIPEGKSVVRPGSACPACKTAIRWYDNIPVLSYLILRAQCRSCGEKVSVRYPSIELLTGLFAILSAYFFGFTANALVHFFFYSVLITISFIDIDHGIIPDVISLPGIPLFFALSFFVSEISWSDAVLGILAGGGSLWLVAFLYLKLTGHDGMGMGDVKLLAMMGAFIGWQGVLFTIFFSSLTGTLIGFTLMVVQRGNMKMSIPYGPFLAAGGAAYTLFGPDLIHWYFTLFR